MLNYVTIDQYLCYLLFQRSLKKIMYSQLDNFFKTQKHLYDNQYGFRTEHFTEFPALELADRVITNMDHNETPLNIYLDLSKAFGGHSFLVNLLNLPIISVQNVLDFIFPFAPLFSQYLVTFASGVVRTSPVLQICAESFVTGYIYASSSVVMHFWLSSSFTNYINWFKTS